MTKLYQHSLNTPSKSISQKYNTALSIFALLLCYKSKVTHKPTSYSSILYDHLYVSNLYFKSIGTLTCSCSVISIKPSVGLPMSIQQPAKEKGPSSASCCLIIQPPDYVYNQYFPIICGCSTIWWQIVRSDWVPCSTYCISFQLSYLSIYCELLLRCLTPHFTLL